MHIEVNKVSKEVFFPSKMFLQVGLQVSSVLVLS